jgi:23S rRNA (uracil1939-C5)-methyltransferase
MVHGGLCLAHDDQGATVLVEGGIPGEEVEVSTRYKKGSTTFAEVVRVVEPSPHRVTPPCVYVPACGGCQLQHVAYPHQVELKRDIVLDALHRQRIAHPAPRVHGATEPWRYRLRGEFHVIAGNAETAPALGFNRARSWRPIAIDDCLIHHPRITTALPALRALIASSGKPELSTLHLTAGEDGQELLVRPKPPRGLAPGALDAGLELPEGGRVSTTSTTLRWRGLTFRVTADAFIQVNWAQMDVLYQCVVDALGGHAGLRVVDAYAGIGVLACHLAVDASEVVCIESNRGAAQLGVLNARVNDVADRVHYVLSPVEDALPRVAAADMADRVIVDPPRAGCAGRVTGWLALAGPGRVVYVSCDPATLARDLHVLVASGPYRVDAIDIVDMFPQTYHVESVVSLVRDEGASQGPVAERPGSR